MSSTNPYDLLKPHWHKFCLGRREVATERHANTGWLHTVGGRATMSSLMRAWGEAVDQICGPATTVEWPDHDDRRAFFSDEDFVDGPCVVAGVMMFVDEVERLSWD